MAFGQVPVEPLVITVVVCELLGVTDVLGVDAAIGVAAAAGVGVGFATETSFPGALGFGIERLASSPADEADLEATAELASVSNLALAQF